MFVVVWRHNERCAWNVAKDLYPTEGAAHDYVRRMKAYDMARREYKLIPVRDEALWIIEDSFK